MASLELVSIEQILKNDATIEHGATDIAKDITNKQYDIVKFCEKLQSSLTSEHVTHRVHGTLLLSRVLHKMSKDYLCKEELDVLTKFYIARLKDHHSVIPAVIEGLYALVHMTHMIGINVVNILQNFFINTTCQSQLRADRYKLYQIFQYTSKRYVSDLKTMSGDYIYGIITSIDGERDPRNLDLIFSYMPEFIATYPLLHLSEEMFEIFACYFPIDFNSTLNDSISVTRDTLSAKLTQCLIASTDFVEWTIQLALEKLSSDLTTAKCDSIDLLHHATLKFSSKLLEPYFEKIWLALKVEIFSDNKAILNAALLTLKSLLTQANKDEDATLSHKYQTLIFGTIITHLDDVNQSFFEPCVRIGLMCVYGDPVYAGDLLLRTFLIKLNEILSTMNEKDEKEQYKRIYNVIAEIFSAIYSSNLTTKNEKKAVNGTVISMINRDICDQIHCYILDHLKNTALQINPNNDIVQSAFKILKESVYIINETNRLLCYEIVINFIRHNALDISNELTEFLQCLSKQQPAEMKMNFLSICIDEFPSFNNFSKEKTLKIFVALIGQTEYNNSILNLIYSQAFSTTINNDERLLSLNALNKLLQNSDYIFINKLQHDTDLRHKFVHLAKTHTDDKDDDILAQIEFGLTLIIQSSSIMEQNKIVEEYLPQLNFQTNSRDLYIAKGLFGFLHSDVRLDEHYERLLKDLIQFCLDNDDGKDQTRQVAYKLLCSLVNKCNYKNAHNYLIVKSIIDKLTKAIKDEKKSAIEAISWLAKGLITCGSDVVEDIIEQLANVLEHPTLGHVTISAFDVISNDYPQLHLPTVKYLYKQKFFHLVLRKFSCYLEICSTQHLSAFVYVLKMTPYTVLKMNIEKIGPVLLNSLKVSNAHTLNVSLNICRYFIQNQDEYFLQHISNVITECLKLSQFKNSMEVRIAALNALLDITKYPTPVILPHKLNVVLELAVPLDDHKRLVRNVAVKASNAWHVVANIID